MRSFNRDELQEAWGRIVPHGVQVGDCLEWHRAENGDGYGVIKLRGRVVLVHRVAFAVHNGSIPDGMIVRHSCDNPACFYYAHLLVGTHRDNTLDALSRGRRRVGELCRNVKLMDSDVDQIRELLAGGVFQKVIAEKFGVSVEMISRVKRGRRVQTNERPGYGGVR